MGLKSLVQSQVRRAFKAIGDLAEDVTLIQKGAASFDFSAGGPQTSNADTTVVKGIKLGKAKDASNREAAKLTYMFMAEDLDFPDIYDKAIVNGLTYTIATPIKNDGYLITVNMNRST